MIIFAIIAMMFITTLDRKRCICGLKLHHKELVQEFCRALRNQGLAL